MMTVFIKAVILFVFTGIIWVLPNEAVADGPKIRELICGFDNTINDELKHLGPGDTLLVSGTCGENISIGEDVHDVTLDGQATATIDGPDASRNTITVRGAGITIRGFTITGGNNGILVSRGGTDLIDGNVIEYVGSHGINVHQNSTARIVNNTIQNNPGDAIIINENSAARIGFISTNDVSASPNIIQNNVGRGIHIIRSSNARVVGNTLINNGDHGVFVNRVSHADLSANTINSNGGSGVFVTRNSGVDLGSDNAGNIFDQPNSTTIGNNNTVNGVRCRINSYVDGSLGSLNGNSGPANFNDGTCVNSAN